MHEEIAAHCSRPPNIGVGCHASVPVGDVRGRVPPHGLQILANCVVFTGKSAQLPETSTATNRSAAKGGSRRCRRLLERRHRARPRRLDDDVDLGDRLGGSRTKDGPRRPPSRGQGAPTTAPERGWTRAAAVGWRTGQAEERDASVGLLHSVFRAEDAEGSKLWECLNRTGQGPPARCSLHRAKKWFSSS
jgi:hypothetical protein